VDVHIYHQTSHHGTSPLPTPSIQSTPQPIPDIVGSAPLSIPSIQPTFQLSPDIGSTPLSIPSIQPTPQPSPDVGCHSNYGTLFTCKDGMWTSSIDVVLNGTNLLHSIFNLSTLFVNGNILISESSINIQNNLFIQKKSVLTLQNCNIFVSGDLYINSQSTIVLNEVDNFTINIKHCAILNGILILRLHQSQTGKRFPILTSPCINGTFYSVFVNLTDTPQCNVIFPHLEYLNDVLSVSFDILNHCTSDTPVWIYIIIGIVSFLLVVGLITSALVVRRKLILSELEMEKLRLKLVN